MGIFEQCEKIDPLFVHSGASREFFKPSHIPDPFITMRHSGAAREFLSHDTNQTLFVPYIDGWIDLVLTKSSISLNHKHIISQN